MKLTDQCTDILKYLLHFTDAISHILLSNTCRLLRRVGDFLPYEYKVGSLIFAYDNIFENRSVWVKTSIQQIKNNRRLIMINLSNKDGWIKVKDIQLTIYTVKKKLNPENIKAGDLINVWCKRNGWTKYIVSHNNIKRNKLAVTLPNSYAYADKSITYDMKIVPGGTHTTQIEQRMCNITYNGYNKLFINRSLTSIDRIFAVTVGEI